MALPVPEPARAALAGWASGHERAEPRLRAVHASGLHVTLAFLGHLPRERAQTVASAALAAAAGAAAPLLAAGALHGVPAGRPRLWALALEDDGGRAAALARAVGEELAAAGLLERRRRAFWPHVTLLRLRGRAAGAAPRPAGEPPRVSFRAGELALYRSITAAAGARYERLARHPLAGGVSG